MIEPAPAAGGLVHPQERLDAVQRADDVDVEGLPEVLDRHVAQRAGPEDAGVVHQHVEPTVVATHEVGDAGPRIRIRDVELDLMRLRRRPRSANAMSPAITVAPLLTQRSAMEAPRPRPAPVTRTILPSSAPTLQPERIQQLGCNTGLFLMRNS